MKVEQVQEIVNQMTSEILGQGVAAQLDLTDVVSVGKTLQNAATVDNYIRKLTDHIGKVVFVDRPYSGRAPSIQMDSWEFGSILEKIDAGIPDAQENPSWNLQDGQSYSQDKFTAPTDVQVQFFNDMTSFEVPMSIAERQTYSAWSSLQQLNAFFNMIEDSIQKSMTVKVDGLSMATINNYIGYVFNNKATKPLQAINLLEGYLKTPGATEGLTAANCLYDLKFLKYAAYQIKLYATRMGNLSTLFNASGRPRFTPTDRMKIIMLSDFAEAADVYLQSDTFHNSFVTLPTADKVSYWQSSGTGYTFNDVTSINVKVENGSGSGPVVNLSGILAVLFDRDALGINNYNRRTKSFVNQHAEFINYWYKADARYFNDFKENFVLFYVADKGVGG